MIYQKLEKNGFKHKEKRSQILMKPTENEKRNADNIKKMISEARGKNITHWNIYKAGQSHYLEENLFYDLSLEEMELNQEIERIERQRKYYDMYFDNEIKIMKDRLEAIQEEKDSTVKLNLARINNIENEEKMRNKEETERINSITNNAIANIKEVLKQHDYADFNNEVERIIRLTLSQPAYNEAIQEVVTEAIKGLFNRSEETKKQPIIKEAPANKKIDELNLSEKEQKALDGAKDLILARYDNHLSKNPKLTLKEFWKKQNDPSIESKKRVMYVVNQRFFSNFDNTTQKNLRRLLNKIMSN